TQAIGDDDIRDAVAVEIAHRHAAGAGASREVAPAYIRGTFHLAAGDFGEARAAAGAAPGVMFDVGVYDVYTGHAGADSGIEVAIGQLRAVGSGIRRHYQRIVAALAVERKAPGYESTVLHATEAADGDSIVPGPGVERQVYAAIPGCRVIQLGD